MDVVCGKFEWDAQKNELNKAKHKISFEEVLPMFDDPLFWERYDFENSTVDEQRYVGTGKIGGFTVAVSAYAERNGRTRIISARISSSEEEKKYEQWCKQFYE